MKILALILLLAAPALASDAAFVRKASQWMASTETSKRLAAYRSWLQLGPEAMPRYQQALEQSRKFHEEAIDKLSAGSRSQANPYDAHDLVADELESARQRVIPLIRTDWEKDPKKVAMLREEMAGLESLHQKLERAARADTEGFDQALDGHLEALFEIRRELERFEPAAATRELSDEDLRSRVLADQVEASHLRKLQAGFQQTRDFLTAHAAADKDNAEAGRWAEGAVKSFAAILNGERRLLGLGPLRIEEKLSEACKGHSADMARLGFFAHDSPVPGKKSPWDRARAAGFKGNASGENIFMGSNDPQAAYNAWFASDGHRFIMLATGPNTLGVGISGRHWTMMTGRMEHGRS